MSGLTAVSDEQLGSTFRRGPRVAPHVDERKEAVSEFLDEIEPGIAKERQWVAPSIEPIPGKKAHGCRSPSQLVKHSQFTHENKRGLISFADKVVESLYGNPSKSK
jgi:hypothetical protein